MSKFGIKIKNYEAGSLYGYNLGVRDRLDSTDAMLTNSLFLDFLKENGLNIWKEESTRDVICIEFNYGTRSYEEESSHFESMIKKIKENEKLTEEEKEKKLNTVNMLKEKAEENKDKYKKLSKGDIRTEFYVNGVKIKYQTHNKVGEVIKEEVITYRMLYRTPGKAKKGSCMFIREELYDVAHNFLYMGITLPEKNSPIVEIGAYASLITSSIVGKVQIKPEQILVLKDVDTFLKSKVTIVATDKNKECYAEDKDNYEIVSTLFDGQALIDSSIFPEWADGYVLLRHHMTKCAAFNTNIELFMRDYFKDEYDTATVKDMWGNEVKVSDIKLITTDNAMKYLKFKVSFEYWSEWVRKNDCMFGIVKTTHESKLGDVQRMSYQMINALHLPDMEKICATSLEYIEKLKTDNKVFLDYLKANANFSNDFDVLVALCEHNSDFYRSEYFRDRKKIIIQSYVLNFKSGRAIQNADNLTLVGSPYAMLLHSVGEDPLTDPTFVKEEGTIQCYTNRFEDGEYLAEFRNPFNSRNNLGYIHNVKHPLITKYFNLGKLCIAVNTIETDFCARNNGSDFDSDSIYTTNQPEIVLHAKFCYANYPTVVNEIKPEKNIYDLSMENYAKIDNTLTAAQLAIGQSSNLAQLCLTYTYNFEDRKYYDYTCILAVVAQCAIDNAKRKYAIDLEKEIPRIQKEIGVDVNGLPKFWQITKKDKRKARNDEERQKRKKETKAKVLAKINDKLVCPMNYIFDLSMGKTRSSESTLPMSEFFVKHEFKSNRTKSRKVEELIEKYGFDLERAKIEHQDSNWTEEETILLLQDKHEELIKDLQSVYISKNYTPLMSWLINRAFCIGSGIKRNINITESELNDYRSTLLKVLYDINSECFLSCFVKKACTLNDF